MYSAIRKRPGWTVALALSAMLVLSAAMYGGRARAALVDSGIVCTTSSSPNAAFTLTATDGYITTADGNSIYTWGYANGSPATARFQLPGPMLCVNQNDTVTIVLYNKLAEDVSLMFPGVDSVQANGAPVQPQFSGGVMTSLTNVAVKGGGTITYSFTATQPGTYIYESGTDASKQVQMGLYGALIVRPVGHPNWAYGRADSQFNPAAEYVMILAEVDPALHQAVERGQSYDVTTFHPRYWMIDGRTFPDTIAPNNASYLVSQPYSALVHIRPKDASNPTPALVRYLNVGKLNHPFHPHGNNGLVIGRDASPLAANGNPAGRDLAYQKYLIMIGPGQTWDVTYDWADVDHWSPSNPIPVQLPQQQNLTYKGNNTWYSGSPYLGMQGDLPTGVTTHNQCGEYYQAWHSHALNVAANYDTGFGGMFTLERIDPPLPNTCP